MSIKQVNGFYESLTQNQALYEQYYNKCSSKGFFGVWDWDKTKIVNFAASLGYQFTEVELQQVWFESESVAIDAAETSDNPAYSNVNYADKNLKYSATIR